MGLVVRKWHAVDEVSTFSESRDFRLDLQAFATKPKTLPKP